MPSMDPVTGLRPRPMLDPRMSATREDWLWELEKQRREGVKQRRSYYQANQFEDVNQQCLAELGATHASERDVVRGQASNILPEHLRLHEYSTQIQESIDYLADRLCSDWSIQAQAKAAQEAIEAALDHSPTLSGAVDDDEVTFLPVVVEAMVADDCPMLVRWDPLEECCWLDCWDSDAVHLEFDEQRGERVVRAEVREQTWMEVAGESRAVELRREWLVEPVFTPDGAPAGRVECVEKVWWQPPDGAEETLLDVIPWGVPVVPWTLVRARRKGLKGGRGQSLIKHQLMRAADRFNAVEQVSWLTARYNSHGNLAVIGDQAMLQIREEGKVHKDVADVLLLPGGSHVLAITLPTDPAMIEHQRQVLLEQLYGGFGLQRMDVAQITTLGQVSGYALEIVNQKSTGTFDRLRTQFARDVKGLLNLVLDCHAWWSASPEVGLATFTGPLGEDGPVVVFSSSVNGNSSILEDWATVPERTFPDRAMEVRMGSGYVVDRVMLRDDVVAGQIPLAERWRQEGRDDDEIGALREELDAESDKKAERQRMHYAAVPDSGRYRPQAGGTVADQ